MTTRAERFHDLVSGRRRGAMASVARAGLWLAQWPYSWGIQARNVYLHRRGGTRVAVPVVSVGNLTVGGTGKTPCVEHLARHYRDRDIRVAILSRGYGTEHGPNDEALVLEDNLPDVPHLQGADRLALAATAVEELEAELLILDDGFQHRHLARDLDIVLIDATNPWGYGHLLPRGLMREPKSALWRADAVVLSRCDQADARAIESLESEISRYIRPRTPIVRSVHRPSAWLRDAVECDLAALAGRPAAAFCGIGHPDSFRRTLADLGFEPRMWLTFPDHHNYTRADVDDLRRWAAELPQDGVVLTTQKDAVKIRLSELVGRELWALRIRLELTVPAGEFESLLDRVP